MQERAGGREIDRKLNLRTKSRLSLEIDKPQQEQLSMTTVISMELSPARKPCILRQKSVTFADEFMGTLASHKPPARKLPMLKQKDPSDYGSNSSGMNINFYRSFETKASPLRRQTSLPSAKCLAKNHYILRQKSVPYDYVEPSSVANNRPRPRQKLDLKLKQPKHQHSRPQQLHELFTVIVLGFLVLVIMFVIFS